MYLSYKAQFILCGQYWQVCLFVRMSGSIDRRLPSAPFSTLLWMWWTKVFLSFSSSGKKKETTKNKFNQRMQWEKAAVKGLFTHHCIIMLKSSFIKVLYCSESVSHLFPAISIYIQRHVSFSLYFPELNVKLQVMFCKIQRLNTHTDNICCLCCFPVLETLAHAYRNKNKR